MEMEEEIFELRNETRLMFDNNSLSIDFTLDGTIDDFGNLSYLECKDNNLSYLNITCEPTFDFSLPLLGKYFLRFIKFLLVSS